jgi:hypothetical protein
MQYVNKRIKPLSIKDEFKKFFAIKFCSAIEEYIC